MTTDTFNYKLEVARGGIHVTLSNLNGFLFSYKVLKDNGWVLGGFQRNTTYMPVDSFLKKKFTFITKYDKIWYGRQLNLYLQKNGGMPVEYEYQIKGTMPLGKVDAKCIMPDYISSLYNTLEYFKEQNADPEETNIRKTELRIDILEVEKAIIKAQAHNAPFETFPIVPFAPVKDVKEEFTFIIQTKYDHAELTILNKISPHLFSGYIRNNFKFITGYRVQKSADSKLLHISFLMDNSYIYRVPNMVTEQLKRINGERVFSTNQLIGSPSVIAMNMDYVSGHDRQEAIIRRVRNDLYDHDDRSLWRNNNNTMHRSYYDIQWDKLLNMVNQAKSDLDKP